METNELNDVLKNAGLQNEEEESAAEDFDVLIWFMGYMGGYLHADMPGYINAIKRFIKENGHRMPPDALRQFNLYINMQNK